MCAILKNILFLSALFAVSSALNCTRCVGNGTKCGDHGKSRMCPAGDGLCGRVTFIQNGVQKVMEDCSLKKFCIGNIDCLKDGFELGKRFIGATDCVVSCCDRDNCDAPAPLKCHQCQSKGQTCKTNSVSCGYKEDRCLRINYKVGNDLMTDERCYQSSRCSDASTTCDLVKKNNTTVKDCKLTCCDTPNCNAVVNANTMAIASSVLVWFLVVLVVTVKM